MFNIDLTVSPPPKAQYVPFDVRVDKNGVHVRTISIYLGVKLSTISKPISLEEKK